MADKPHYTAQQMVEALESSRGLVSVAAKRMRCSPTTIRAYAKKHKSVAEAMRDQRAEVTDMAEAALFKAISNGEAWAVCFYLKTQGKDRGYVERTEQHQSGDITIRVEYADVDPGLTASTPRAISSHT